MNKRLTIRAKILWIAFAINALCMATYTINSCHQQKKAFLKGIDEKLLSVAYALPKFLPEDIHDEITGPNSISPERHLQMLTLLSDYANTIGVMYLYSYMEFDEKFYVATTSATKEEIESEKETLFFTEYKQPPDTMIEAWKINAIRYDEYEDEWGNFRSIFIPMRTSAGSRFIVGADVSLDFVKGRLREVVFMNILLGIIIFFIVWLISHFLLIRIFSPISNLTSYTHELMDANFRLPEKKQKELSVMAGQYHDEVGYLAKAFSEMQSKLLEYIKNLKETTAAKERIESELNIAHDIQMSLLPKTFPPFPERKEFDLYATLEPAREVGGDLFDFFFIDDDHFCFALGDVSDKGVPAALFMSVTMALIKNSFTKNLSPADMMYQINNTLSIDNQYSMFVTLIIGILNVQTGKVKYSNGGHNPPILISGANDVAYKKDISGLLVGAMEDSLYKDLTINMAAGDALFLYTDGVTEAMNPEKELFSEERLIAEMKILKDNSSKKTISALMVKIKEHVGTAPQSDDIAMMMLKYNGKVV